jgi:hypothetical protein
MRTSTVLRRKEQTPEYDERDAEALVLRVAQGNESARDELFAKDGPRLCLMVRARIGRNSSARDDRSDILQKAMAVAAERLDQYVRDARFCFLRGSTY